MKFLLCPVVLIFATLIVTSAVAEESVKIGWIGPLSGNSAVLGIDSIKAAEFAVKDVNSNGGVGGRKVELLAEDDQHDTSNSVSAYKKLYASGVRQFLVSTYGGVFAIAPQAVKDGSIILNPLDANNDLAVLSDNVFAVATESESIGKAIAEHIDQLSLRPVGLIYDEGHPFMLLVAKFLQSHFTGGALSVSESVDQSRIDSFRSILLKAKKANVKSLVLLGHDPMGLAMREAKELRLNVQFYTVGTITSPGFQKIAGKAANGTYVAFWEAPSTPALEAFLARFKSEVGRDPLLQLATIPTYDSTRILLASVDKAIKLTGSPSASAVRDALHEVRDHVGLSGVLTMDDDGIVRSIKERIFRFNDGTLTPFEGED